MIRYKYQITLCTLLGLIFISAGKPKDLKEVVLDDLIKETQFRPGEAGQGEIKLVWWLPTQFWAAIYSQNDDVSQETSDLIVSAMDKYTMVIVLDGEVNALGGLTAKSSKKIRSNIVVRDGSGKEFKPLDNEDIDGEAQMVLTILKPVFSNLLGKMGENMELLMFTNKEESILDPFEVGGDIVYDDEKIDLELPLASLLQDKECPKDSATMNAKWDYCPYHGVELAD